MAETTIGPYRILQKLAAGGMGEVYLCDDPRLGRRVAVKRATGSWTESTEGRERLRREARAAASLNHPHIAAVYDVVETTDGPHVVMEYVEGDTLSAVIRRGRLPLDRALAIGMELTEAVSAAHHAGIVHRDLKPSNVMITNDGHVKVLDFGLAKRKEPADGSRRLTPLSAAGMWMGTPGYSAPEQYFGASDHRSDLYSVGAILYQLFTGRPALEGSDALALATAASKPVVPPARVAPDVPEPVSDVITRLMAVRPAERPRSADEVRTVLAAALGALSSASTSVPVVSRRLTSKRPALWVTGAVVMALLAGAAYYRWRADATVTASPTAPVVLAVLPLENLSGDPANDFLGNGFAASLITDLSTVPGLTVLSRAAVREVEPTANPTRVARQLGATLVLAGSVHRSGDRLRVDLVLTRPDGTVAWSRPFTGSVPALLDLQPHLASSVSGALPLRVGSEVRQRLARAPTNNVDALAAYWRGRQLLDSPDDPASIDGAVKALTEAVRLDDSFASAHAALVEAYWEQYSLTRDPEWVNRALAASDRALALDPQQPTAWVSRAVMRRGTGRSTDALADIERALQLQPNNDEALRLKARVLTDLGRRDEGIGVLQQAIALRPEYWGNYDVLGGAYYFAGRRREAIEAYERVVQLNPNSARGYHNLGIVYQEEGDRARALENYRKAVSITPTAPTLSAIGALQYAGGEYEQALSSFREAAKVSPNNPNMHRNLGDVLARLGRRVEARQAYAQAVALARKELEVNPTSAVTLSRLGVYLAKMGDAAEAHRYARRALDEASNSSDIHYRAAVTYALTGRRDDAITELRAAIGLGYSPTLVRQDEDLASILQDPAVQQLLADKAAGENRRPE